MNNVQRILKRVLACTAAIVLAVTLCLAAAAEVAYQPTAQFFVNDFADVLSAQTEQEIVELGRALQQQTGAQAVAVTVPSLGGQSVEDYAIDLANSWGIGQAEEDNGVLILIAVEERKLRVEVGLGLEGALPDGKTGRIMDEYMTPSLRQNDYSTGMLEGYKAVASQIYQEYGIEAPELSGYEASNNQNTGNRQDIPTVLTLISPIALVILLLILRLVSHGRGFPFFWFFGGREGHAEAAETTPSAAVFPADAGAIWRSGGFSGGGGSSAGRRLQRILNRAKKRNMGCCKAFCNSPCFFSYSRCTSGGQSSIPSKMLSS